MKNKICSLFLIALLTSASCFAQTETKPFFYEKVSTVTSTSPAEEQEVINVEIAQKADGHYVNMQADPVHLKLHQKIGEIAVYWYVENRRGIKTIDGKQVLRFYYSLDKDSVDSEFLKVTGGEWGFLQYCWLGNTNETYQFIPQKPGTTTLRYLFEDSVIEVPIIIDEDPIENNSSSVSDVFSE